MVISKELFICVFDGDLHTKLFGIEYSTDLREIVTVGDMINQYKSNIKPPAATDGQDKTNFIHSIA